MHGGNMDGAVERQCQQFIDEVVDGLEALLVGRGLRREVSFLFRPFSIYVILGRDVMTAVFLPSPSGLPDSIWNDLPDADQPPDVWQNEVQLRKGGPALGTLAAPKSVVLQDDHRDRGAVVQAIADGALRDIERAIALGALGDLTGLTHLETPLRAFLADHPTFDRNVFVMMRFKPTAQHRAIIETIRASLAANGYDAVRADDKAYVDELWSNIQVYALGCRFGIAVFEDIDAEPLNPNVALELGYMMARRKRTLILKEQRLAALPSDVIGHLYKPFDMFTIERSIRDRVNEWVNVDLAG